MRTAADVVREARSEIGYGEKPRGSNRTKFAAEAGLGNATAWCAVFVVALMNRCNVDIPKATRTASSRTMYAEAVKRGLGVPMKSVRRGDVVHMRRGKARLWLGHVGIVDRVLPNGMITTIEGNTNGQGSATGGSVLQHTRNPSAWTLGAWRPPYAPPAPPQVISKVLWRDSNTGAVYQPAGPDTGLHLSMAQWNELTSKGWVTIAHAPPKKVLP